MDDKDLAERLRRGFPADAEAPAFEHTWTAAEARYRTSRRRYAGFAAAAVVAAAVLVVLTLGQPPRQADSEVIEALMSSTSWSAPSDVLLPKRQFDIYQDLPALNTSTQTAEGALL